MPNGPDLGYGHEASVEPVEVAASEGVEIDVDVGGVRHQSLVDLRCLLISCAFTTGEGDTEEAVAN